MSDMLEPAIDYLFKIHGEPEDGRLFKKWLEKRNEVRFMDDPEVLYERLKDVTEVLYKLEEDSGYKSENLGIAIAHLQQVDFEDKEEQ